MADPLGHRKPDGTRTGFHRRAGTLVRRWALLIGIVVAIHLIAAIVLLHVTGYLGPVGH